MTDLEWTAPKSEIGGVQIKEGIVTLVEKVEVNGVPLADVLSGAAIGLDGVMDDTTAVLRALAVREAQKHRGGKPLYLMAEEVFALCDTALKLMDQQDAWVREGITAGKETIRRLTEERDQQVEDLNAAYLQLAPAGSPILLPLSTSVVHWARQMREERDRLREALHLIGWNHMGDTDIVNEALCDAVIAGRWDILMLSELARWVKVRLVRERAPHPTPAQVGDEGRAEPERDRTSRARDRQTVEEREDEWVNNLCYRDEDGRIDDS